MNKVIRKTKFITNGYDFFGSQARKWAKVAGTITIKGSIADGIFTKVTSVHNSSTNVLGYTIKDSHTKARWHINLCLTRNMLFVNLVHKVHKGIVDIDNQRFNTKELDNLFRIFNIGLDTIRHHNTNNIFLTKCLYTKCGTYSRILTTRNTNHNLTAIGLLKVVANPFNNLFSESFIHSSVFLFVEVNF